MDLTKLLFRALSLCYVFLFCTYFYYRLFYSIGSEYLWWRYSVLAIEFLSSFSVVFVVLVRLRAPWSGFVDQEDGIQLSSALKRSSAVAPKKPTVEIETEMVATTEGRESFSLLNRPSSSVSVKKTTSFNSVSQVVVPEEQVEDEHSPLLEEVPEVEEAGSNANEEASKEKEFSVIEKAEADCDEIESASVQRRVSFAVSEGRRKIPDVDDDKVAESPAVSEYVSIKVPSPVAPENKETEEVVKEPVKAKPKPIYTLRILIPCYKESLDIVKATCMSALRIKHDPTHLHVYLCDDGADPEKSAWVESMQKDGYTNMNYITRPEQFKGHGKAGNLNYALHYVIYRAYSVKRKSKKAKRISPLELVVVFDADMVCLPKFAQALLPYFERDRRCVMVQSPQTFHNIPPSADFFDAHNINFFQYQLPAMSVWNTTTCCGTNFMVSARALRFVGWFPTISVTEDMYLAMQLLAAGGRIRYHGENLVIGEAPEDLRQIFQQRSRWAKGTMQILLKDNPLTKKGLPLIARLSFFNAAWSYITSAFMNPMFVVMNAVAILFGLFPVRNLNFTVAMLFIAYYTVFYVVIHFSPQPSKHFVNLWVVGKMGHFFSYMALKAIVRIIQRTIMKRNVDFKVTKKTVHKFENKQDDGDLEVKDPEEPKEESKEEEVLENSKSGYGDDDEEGKCEKGAESEDHEDEFSNELAPLSPKFDGDDLHAEHEAEIEDSSGANGNRDSSRVDLRYHILMCSFMVFVIAYGVYCVIGFEPFIPAFTDNARTLQQQLGIKLFCCMWMLQFFIAYSLPLFYAMVPHKFSLQAKVLKGLAGFDIALSLAFLVISILLFQLGFLNQLPNLKSAYLATPSSTPFWMSDEVSSNYLGNYIHDTAMKNEVPVIVAYNRPNRDPDMFAAGGLDDWETYRAWLSSVASVISDKDFPVVLILEPGWLSESITGVSNASLANTVEVDVGSDTVYVTLDVEKYYRCINAFSLILSELPSHTLVFVDAADPYWHSKMGPAAMQLLHDSMFGKAFTGISLNVGGYYSSASVRAYGSQVFSEYGLNFIEDTSRNGGLFSALPEDNIAECRFDPPNMDVGADPEWQSANVHESELVSGLLGNLWVKQPGVSDGRLYPFGTEKECLIGHKIPCNDVCPEIPESNAGVFFRSPTCRCG